MKAIITIGIPASGKTVWAEEYARKNGFVNVNRDDLRFTITGHRSWGTYKFKGETENMVTDMQRCMIKEAANRGKSVIVSDTNLVKRRRDELVKFLKDTGFAVEFKEFHVSLEEAYKRDALRVNGVGRDVIYSMYQKYLEHTGRRVYTPDESLPEAVCFDVDGTLALMHGNRGPFDWDKVDTDLPNQIVVETAKLYFQAGKKIVILSGRDGSCRELTEKWLAEMGVNYHVLLMREAGDSRKDTIIKEEIFWRDVAPNYNVKAVYDDRPVVVRNWIEMKVPVMAVGNPYLEF